MKRRIRLTESDLHRIINRSVKRTLNEIRDTAETFGEFADTPYRTLHTGLKSKKEQMDSDWEDLDEYYPFGHGRYPADYDASELARLNYEDWNPSQLDNQHIHDFYLDR